MRRRERKLIAFLERERERDLKNGSEGDDKYSSRQRRAEAEISKMGHVALCRL